ncbi:MAG: ferredoxin--NADP reductase [Candidatus Binataceae bacterium]
MTSGASPDKRGRHSARVERIFDHNGDTRSMFISSDGGKPLKFVPGQFISMSIPLGDETRSRAYSIASSSDEPGPLEICFNRVPDGRGVEWLFNRTVGDPIEFTGPFGTFTLGNAPEAETVFIAEGTAIAPIRPMLKRARAGPAHPKMQLLYGASDEAHILYREEFATMVQANSNLSFDTIIAPGDSLYDRLCEIADTRWIKSDSDRTRNFYLCGIGAGVIRLRDRLRAAGYDRRAVHYEKW